MGMKRRKFLATAGSGAIAILAGARIVGSEAAPTVDKSKLSKSVKFSGYGGAFQ